MALQPFFPDGNQKRTVFSSPLPGDQTYTILFFVPSCFTGNKSAFRDATKSLWKLDKLVMSHLLINIQLAQLTQLFTAEMLHLKKKKTVPVLPDKQPPSWASSLQPTGVIKFSLFIVLFFIFVTSASLWDFNTNRHLNMLTLWKMQKKKLLLNFFLFTERCVDLYTYLKLKMMQQGRAFQQVSHIIYCVCFKPRDPANLRHVHTCIQTPLLLSLETKYLFVFILNLEWFSVFEVMFCETIINSLEISKRVSCRKRLNSSSTPG